MSVCVCMCVCVCVCVLKIKEFIQFHKIINFVVSWYKTE